MSTMVKESKYIMADIENNNNKFWNITLFDDYKVTTHWGRVGENGQSKTFSHANLAKAEAFFASKCNEKRRKGYNEAKVLANTVKVEASNSRNLAEIAKQQIVSNSTLVLDLIEYLSEVNIHQILSATTMTYDSSKGTFSTPLGIVTKDALLEARKLLNQLGDFVLNKDYNNYEFTRVANLYLMRIPRDIGRGKPDLRSLYPNLKAIQEQNDILDALDASLHNVLTAGSSSKDKNTEKKVFEAKVNYVEDGKIIDVIRKKYKSTLQSNHACAHLDVEVVYEIEIASMAAAFEVGKKVGNIMSLWHGSRAGNIISILKNGFVIPPSTASHVCGRMYGDGYYAAIASTKSLNYSYGYWDNKSKDNSCFMFLNDVAMGKPFTPKSGMSYDYPVRGYDSTWAKGGISGVIHDECIVYNTNQVNPKYLIKFSAKKR